MGIPASAGIKVFLAIRIFPISFRVLYPVHKSGMMSFCQPSKRAQ
jgi:hypothetical protein